MKEPQPGQRFNLCASLEDMEVNPKGEFALASDLDDALDLLERWRKDTMQQDERIVGQTEDILRKHGRLA